MAYLIITDDASRADLEEAMSNLRHRQLLAVIPSTRAEIGDEIDVLLEAWVVAT